MPEAEKARVLCVDDDRDVAELVRSLLVDEGYEVTCLYDVSGEKFPRVLGQLEPDCVSLDVLLDAPLVRWSPGRRAIGT